jgi:GNAT superfamily N-acetyltransferase
VAGVRPPLAFELVDLVSILPLRRRLLNPEKSIEDSTFPGDHDSRTAHAVALAATSDPKSEFPLAIATVLPEAPPWDSARTDGWRLRGLGTEPEFRGNGVARDLIATLVGYVAGQGGGVLWSGTGMRAVSLFDRAGFTRMGPPFDIPHLGRHQTVWMIVESTVGGAAGTI